MGSMSGAIFIGAFHPNDGDLIPSHVIQVIEGNTLAYVVTPLDGGSPQRWLMVDPERAVPLLCAAIALQYPEASSHPLATQSEIDASTLSERDLNPLEEAFRISPPGIAAALGWGCIIKPDQLVTLNDADLTIFQTVYQRSFSHWRNEISVVDNRTPQE